MTTMKGIILIVLVSVFLWDSSMSSETWQRARSRILRSLDDDRHHERSYETDVDNSDVDTARVDINDIFNVRSVEEAPVRRPGFLARITQKGFDFAAQLSTKIVMKELTKISIPTLRHKIASTEVTVSNIDLQMPQRPGSRLFPIPYPGYGLRWHAYNINPTITAEYRADMDLGFWTVTKKGTAKFIGDDIFFALDFFVASDENGRPTTEVTSCVSDGDIEMKFKGGWDDMINVGATVFKNEIRSMITAQICFQAKTEINAKLSEQLRTIPLYQTVFDEYLIDLSMLGNPHFTDDAVDIPFKGALYLEKDMSEPPFTPPEITEHDDHTARMIYLYLTDYFVNSAFYTTYRNGLLAYNVTPAMVPDEFRHYLNTTCGFDICLGTIFPQLAVAYPGEVVSVGIRATESPLISMVGNQLNVTANGEADVFVVSPSGERTTVFVIDVVFEAGLEIGFKGQEFFFNVSHLVPSARVKESSIGDIGSGFFFESILRVATQKVLIPRLTEFGQKGYTLPGIKGVEFLNPIIVESDMENVLIVATDIGYEVHRKRNQRIQARRQFWMQRRAERRQKRAMMAAARGPAARQTQ